MKHFLVQYYSRQNLGDDLFIKILADHFPDCKINLLANPKYIPKNLNSNIRIHPLSWGTTLAGKLQSILGRNHPCSRRIDKTVWKWRQKLIDVNDASVLIGGSLYMQSGHLEDEIDFQINQKPVYDYDCQIQKIGKSFIIGANLGPIFTNDYVENMKRTFDGFTHVCLRDYASYSLVKELPHVQYAPDVIFLAQQPKSTTCKENVVISVIDISERSKDNVVIDSYYTLLRDTIIEFNKKQIHATLVSFCKREGDEHAIQSLIRMLPSDADFSVHAYNGDIEATLTLFSNACYIIASRFHSMVLGISFGKPVFPISYNCKMQNYLNDLDFSGRYATLNTLSETTYQDILYNYENQIITDCSLHKKYAENQFRALRTFLDSL